jgi:hypothetical protein
MLTTCLSRNGPLQNISVGILEHFDCSTTFHLDLVENKIQLHTFVAGN